MKISKTDGYNQEPDWTPENFAAGNVKRQKKKQSQTKENGARTIAKGMLHGTQVSGKTIQATKESEDSNKEKFEAEF